MLNRHPETPQGAVMSLIVRCKLTAPRLFATQAGLWVSLSQPLITTIGNDPRVRMQVGVLLLEQGQIVL